MASSSSKEYIPSKAEWDFVKAIHAERARQINMGYTAKHDRIGGIKHLVNLSIDYIYHDEKVKAAAVLLAILELYRTINERKWFFIGGLVGAIFMGIILSIIWVILINVSSSL